MANARKTAALCFTGALLLAGCSDDMNAGTMWPSLEGDASQASSGTSTGPQDGQMSDGQMSDGQSVNMGGGAGTTSTVPSAPMPTGTYPPASASLPPSGGGTYSSRSVTSYSSVTGMPTATNTHVGLRINALQQDLARLQNSINVHRQSYQTIRPRAEQNAEAYQGTVAPVYARLQVGSTPGNPQLAQMWNEAEMRLDLINDDIDQLNALGNAVVQDAAMASYLLEAVRASYGLAGAYEEDHRQLALLEDEVNRTVIDVDRLLSDISTDINRQGNYVAAERANLTALALAIKTGSFFQSPIRDGSGIAGGFSGFASSGPSAGSEVAIIRFDKPNLRYQTPLKNAIRQVLESNPGANFEVLGISAQQGSTARVRRRAEAVYKTLTQAGVPADRVSLTAISGDTSYDEVHVFQR